MKKTNSTHLPEIINNYNQRRFGFASKNFYAEFLAALDVVNNYKNYFGDISIKQPLKFDVVQIERSMFLRDIERYCSISKDEIKKLNLALQGDVIDSRVYIPKGFALRIPEGKKKPFIKDLRLLPVSTRQRRRTKRQRLLIS